MPTFPYTPPDSTGSEEEALLAQPPKWRRAVGPADDSIVFTASIGPAAGVLVAGLTLAALVLAQPARRPAQPTVALEEDDGLIVYTATNDTSSTPGRPTEEEVVHHLQHGGHMNCSNFPYLKLKDITLNNLGGKGPDTDREPGLIYAGEIQGGPNAGDTFELHLNVTSDPALYEPENPRETGFQGEYGSINIKSGTNVTITFEKYDPRNQAHVPFEHFFFTFFDLDQGPDGSASESITVRGWTRASLANRTEANVTRLPDGRTRFEATTEGSGSDNPRDPLQLTRQQFRRAVTILVAGVETFEVTFAVGPSAEANPRWFNFRGQPTLLCAAREDGSHFHLQVIGPSGAHHAGTHVALALLLLGLLRQLLA